MSMSEPVNLLPRGWTESSRSPHAREGAHPCPASLSGARICPISEPEIVNVWRFLYLMPCLALLDLSHLLAFRPSLGRGLFQWLAWTRLRPQCLWPELSSLAASTL